MRSPEVPIDFNPVDLYSPSLASLLTMILLTTFIATLFLTEIARAVPQACQYSISPQSSTPEGYFRSPTIYTAKHDSKFDQGNGKLSSTSCLDSELAKDYPRFKEVPFFDKIGGAFKTPSNKPSYPCGTIWELTNAVNDNYTAFFVSIDSSDGPDFSLSDSVYKELGAGDATPSLTVVAKLVGHIDDFN